MEESIGDFQTDAEEVIRLVKDINALKSSGIDEIASRLCEDAFMVLPDQLTHLFNCSLRLGIFPEKWKAAKVIPLFKGGDRESVNNYRPVSLLPLPGKLLEKIVHIKIFLEDQTFLSQHQGGFRKGFSTTSTIADLTDDLFTGINEGKTTLGAFIDLKKAFDTVDFEILLKKLNRAGIRGNTLKWCSSYLMGRSQRTLSNGTLSDSLPTSCGVPQGSVLGPLLFLVYINDLQDAVANCNVKLYADDTVLYHSGNNVEDVTLAMQTSLNHFSRWCKVNKLTINTKKTKLMAFGSRSRVKRVKKVKIYLNGDLLQKLDLKL